MYYEYRQNNNIVALWLLIVVGFFFKNLIFYKIIHFVVPLYVTHSFKVSRWHSFCYKITFATLINRVSMVYH